MEKKLVEKQFEAPKLDEDITVPPIKPNSMSHSSPFVAAPQHQEALGLDERKLIRWTMAKGGRDIQFQSGRLRRRPLKRY